MCKNFKSDFIHKPKNNDYTTFLKIMYTNSLLKMDSFITIMQFV